MREDSPIKGKSSIEINPSRAGSTPPPPATLWRSWSAPPRVWPSRSQSDERPVEKTRVSDNGVLTFKVTAPSEFGLHSLTIRDAQTRKTIDGAMFLVRHEDTREKQQAG
jgi:hypothetical protein